MFRRWLAVVLVVTASAQASADESLTPKDVLTVMVRRRAEIRKVCWEQSAAKADTAVKVDFQVAPTGVVTDVKPADASGPASIITCILAEVKKTTFIASEKGGHFRWPFIFKGP
jgi:hypothetical protein